MGVQFQNEQNSYSTVAKSSNTGLIGWLIKNGAAKDKAQANKILLVVIVVLVVIMMFSVGSISKNPKDVYVEPNTNLNPETGTYD